MAHGTPDWGAGSPKATVYSLADMAELAARLGSIVTYDRRGDVVWMDDFEDNINKWGQLTSGAGTAIALTTDCARSGAKSVKLTTGDESGDIAFLYRYQGMSAITSNIGFECSFVAHDSVAFDLGLNAYLANHGANAVLRYDPVAGVLQLYTTGAAWITLISGLGTWPAYTWHTVKIVCNFTGTGVYRRVMFDNLTLDVADIPLRTYFTISQPHLKVGCTAVWLEGVNPSMYVDDAIITQNEP